MVRESDRLPQAQFERLMLVEANLIAVARRCCCRRQVMMSLPAGNHAKISDMGFDPNLSGEIKISLSQAALKRQTPGIPATLVKDYRLELLSGETVVHQIEAKGNYLRHRVHALPEAVSCDRVKLTVLATRGDARARIFEVRVYE